MVTRVRCAICSAPVESEYKVASAIYDDHEEEYQLCRRCARLHVERGTFGLLRAIDFRLRALGYAPSFYVDGQPVESVWERV